MERNDTTGWRPSLGAWRDDEATRFRVWAPEARQVELRAEVAGGLRRIPLQKSPDGYFQAVSPEVKAGALYSYCINGQGPYPDPASRFQPQGVHGPSQVVDAASYRWEDGDWHGIDLPDVILYELHIGTFTPQGTFSAAAGRLPYLRDLGVTAVELMPVADFAGNRNWGYDGVALFAPARCYGTPDDLRRFVNTAHRLGLAVHLDVVYNHLGPDGAYHQMFSPYYASRRHSSPWGAALNFDGPQSAAVRAFFIENALHWIHEYHMDGLRLDATHAIVDESPQHFLAELAGRLRDSLAGSARRVLLIAEDARNLACMVQPAKDGGWAMDAVWSDDFHHQLRRCLAGDCDGYFQDFAGTAQDIAATAQRGWFYCGQYSPYFGGPRGTDPAGIPLRRFVFFLQNHDQVGNRAFGDRLHHAIDLASYRAATALLLLLPETPLLFMGQEWAASSPFQYFTDHVPELGAQVTEGRRNEFSRFAAFADPNVRASIPDPQAAATFERSRLPWQELEKEPHRSTLCFYRRLISLRRSTAAWHPPEEENLVLAAPDSDTVVLRRESGGKALLALIRLRGAGRVVLPEAPVQNTSPGEWAVVFTSEEPEFAADPLPPRIVWAEGAVEFRRPGAVLLTTPASAGGH